MRARYQSAVAVVVGHRQHVRLRHRDDRVAGRVARDCTRTAARLVERLVRVAAAQRRGAGGLRHQTRIDLPPRAVVAVDAPFSVGGSPAHAEDNTHYYVLVSMWFE